MQADDKVLSFQGYTLDLRCGCLRRADHEIELRPKSFAVLRYLVENAGRLVSKDELIGTVWTNTVATDVSLARCASDVRLALRDQEQQIIRTVPRRGYLFVAPVAEAANGGVLADRAPDDTQPQPRPGECRQLTIMSCELVGLATLSASTPRICRKQRRPVGAAAQRLLNGTMATLPAMPVMACWPGSAIRKPWSKTSRMPCTRRWHCKTSQLAWITASKRGSSPASALPADSW